MPLTRLETTFRCPFCEPGESACPVSMSALPLDSRRKRLYCTSDNFDNCPIFLSHLLRSSQPAESSLNHSFSA